LKYCLSGIETTSVSWFLVFGSGTGTGWVGIFLVEDMAAPAFLR
jgi:hypothetical protein